METRLVGWVEKTHNYFNINDQKEIINDLIQFTLRKINVIKWKDRSDLTPLEPLMITHAWVEKTHNYFNIIKDLPKWIFNLIDWTNESSSESVIRKIKSSELRILEPLILMDETEELDQAWDYLGSITYNYTVGDLAGAVRLSALRSISQNTWHTLESIEKGIQDVRNAEAMQPNDQYEFLSWAYYQVGNAFIHTQLPELDVPRALTLSLRPITTEVQANIPSINTFSSLLSFQNRMIGFYSGKAAELLFLSPMTTKKTEKTEKTTDLLFSQQGCEVIELFKASYIAYALINKYCSDLEITRLWKWSEIPTYVALIQKRHYNLNNISQLKFIDEVNKVKRMDFPLVKAFALSRFPLKTDFIPIHLSDTFKLLKKTKESFNIFGPVKYNKKWDKIFVKKKFNYLENFSDQVPVDNFHQEIDTLKALYKLKNRSKNTSIQTPITWTDLCQLNKDYMYQGVILTSFNQAFHLLDENRELLDYLVFYLFRFDVIQPRFLLQFASKLTSQERRSQQLSDKFDVLIHVNEKEKINHIIKRKQVGPRKMYILTSSQFITFTPKP